MILKRAIGEANEEPFFEHVAQQCQPGPRDRSRCSGGRDASPTKCAYESGVSGGRSEKGGRIEEIDRIKAQGEIALWLCIHFNCFAILHWRPSLVFTNCGKDVSGAELRNDY